MSFVSRLHRLVVFFFFVGLLSVQAVAQSEISLANDVPVSGISGAAGSERHYSITVPSGATRLLVTTTSGSGDVDVYVRRGSRATTSNYDEASAGLTATETIALGSPAAGTYYILLRGYGSYSGVVLRAVVTVAADDDHGNTAAAATAVNLNSTTAGVINSGGDADYFRFDVGTAGGTLTVFTTGSTDVVGSLRNSSDQEIASDDDSGGNGNFRIVRTNVGAGRYYVRVAGYGGGTTGGYSLRVQWSPGDVITDTPLASGVAASALAGAAGSERYFTIVVPSGATRLTVNTSGGSGDPDIIVLRGRRPTLADANGNTDAAVSASGGTFESVAIAPPTPGTYHILVYGYAAYSSVTLRAVVEAGPPPAQALQNDVAVTGLAGATGSQRLFTFEVPAGQTSVVFATSGGSGDADLFVRRGQVATTQNSDWSSYSGSNVESIRLTNPAGGTYHVLVHGYSEYSGVSLRATYSGTVDVTPLTNNVPVSDISGATGSSRLYRIDVPTGQNQITITTAGGSGDVDVMVRRGERPTSAQNDGGSYGGNNQESITISNPAAGTYFVLLSGYSAYSGVVLRASYGAAPPPPADVTLANNTPVNAIAGAMGSYHYYRVEVPSGQSRLVITTSGGTGDADVLVRRGQRPTFATNDGIGISSSNSENVIINDPAAGTYHIAVFGYSAYSGLTLRATYSSGPITQSARVLTSGVPVTLEPGAQGSAQLFRVTVPAGQTRLRLVMSGGTGDADMYVRRGAAPTTSSFDQAPYLSNNNETVEINGAIAGDYFVLVHGYAAFSGAQLRADVSRANLSITLISEPRQGQEVPILAPSFRGRVTDESGAGVGGVAVAVSDSIRRQSAQIITGSDGYWNYTTGSVFEPTIASFEFVLDREVGKVARGFLFTRVPLPSAYGGIQLSGAQVQQAVQQAVAATVQESNDLSHYLLASQGQITVSAAQYERGRQIWMRYQPVGPTLGQVLHFVGYAIDGAVCAVGVAGAVGTAGVGTAGAVVACLPLATRITSDVADAAISTAERKGLLSPTELRSLRATKAGVFTVLELANLAISPNPTMVAGKAARMAEVTAKVAGGSFEVIEQFTTNGQIRTIARVGVAASETVDVVISFSRLVD